MICEIIHVQVGQCRSLTGNAFWNTMSAEHKLGKDSKFTENKEEGELIFVQRVRAALIDLEAASLELIKASPIGTMFKADNFMFCASGAGNNEGGELMDEIVDGN